LIAALRREKKRDRLVMTTRIALRELNLQGVGGWPQATRGRSRRPALNTENRTMSIRLNVGVSRKVGLPDFCSAGASCNLEVELDSGLLQHDLDEFRAQVRDAFVAAQQAVNDELIRLQDRADGVQRALPAPHVRSSQVPHANGAARAPGSAGRTEHGNGAGRNSPRRDRPPKPCTVNQVRAIRTIARNVGLDLAQRLHEEFGVEIPEDLTLGQASRLIDALKGANGD